MQNFQPLAFETLGQLSSCTTVFLTELGRRLSASNGEPRETAFLFQCLSVAVQRFNAVLIPETFDLSDGQPDFSSFFYQFLPARRYASAGYRDRNVSVCLSVRPSVTRRNCVKTKKASGMISSPSGSPKTLVFRRQISSPNSKGFPRTGASNKGRS